MARRRGGLVVAPSRTRAVDTILATRPTMFWPCQDYGSAAWEQPRDAMGRAVAGSGFRSSSLQYIVITGSPTGGTFTISHNGYTTGAITFSTTSATLGSNVDAAMEALHASYSGGIVATANVIDGAYVVMVHFWGASHAFANKDQPTLTVDISGLTGGSPAAEVIHFTGGRNVVATDIGPGGIRVLRQDGPCLGASLAAPTPSSSICVGLLYRQMHPRLWMPSNRLFTREGVSNQNSWRLSISGAADVRDRLTIVPMTATGSAVVTANATTADGSPIADRWCWVMGSFDGTTGRTRVIDDRGRWTEGSAGSPSGTWHTGGGSSIAFGTHTSGGVRMPHFASLYAIWNDRIPSDAEAWAIANSIFG